MLTPAATYPDGLNPILSSAPSATTLLSNSTPRHWVSEQRRAFGTLAGQVISRYSALEMAFVEEGAEGGPVFGGEDAPFLQLNWLRLHLANGTVVTVQTYQSDWSFGLWVVDDDTARGFDYATKFGAESIFRAADLAHLPTGTVEHVVTELDAGGELSVVTLVVGTAELELVAGEVREQRTGPPEVNFGDESVLVFTDSAIRRTLMGRGSVVPLDRW